VNVNIPPSLELTFGKALQAHLRVSNAGARARQAGAECGVFAIHAGAGHKHKHEHEHVGRRELEIDRESKDGATATALLST
jgi:hypothetical protein